MPSSGSWPTTKPVQTRAGSTIEIRQAVGRGVFPYRISKGGLVLGVSAVKCQAYTVRAEPDDAVLAVRSVAYPCSAVQENYTSLGVMYLE